MRGIPKRHKTVLFCMGILTAKLQRTVRAVIDKALPIFGAGRHSAPQDSIQRLIDTTTLVSVESTSKREFIHGVEYPISRFQSDRENKIDPSAVDEMWEEKWQSFGSQWTRQLQDYRFLCDAFLLFRLSFEQLRTNKVLSIYATNREEKLRFNNVCGLNLYGVYHHGKKCCDLMKKLKLIKKADQDSCNRFSETRNKLIEHNHDPREMDVQIEPSIWSLIGTDSFMSVAIHNDSEGAFEARVDYYEDYYILEKIIMNAIEILAAPSDR
jgi:hypothetical protein